MKRGTPSLCALVAGLAMRAGSASAQVVPPPEPVPGPVSWSDAIHPARRDAERRLADAVVQLIRLDEQRYALEGAVLFDVLRPQYIAVARELRSVTDQAPDLASAWVHLARALENLDVSESIHALERARPLAQGGPQMLDVLFMLGAVYTRAQKFEAARAAYESALPLPMADRARATMLCNLAEVYTYVGEADRSIDTYRACAAQRAGDADAFWGLASAADRAGRESEAREAAARAVGMDPTLDRIRGPDVFFVPEYEIHYYLGLAFEAMAQPERALAEWRHYLDAGGRDDAWAARANTHVHRLEAELRAGERGRERSHASESDAHRPIASP
jgi:tetratricopeptide (TPR) repeat protein